MKLLFDANLSPKLVGRLAELFPDSVHVFDTGLQANGFTIVTADSDFLDFESCNYRTSVVEDLLRRNAIWIAELEQSSRVTLVIRNTA